MQTGAHDGPEIGVEEACAGGRRRITVDTPSGPRSHLVDIPAGVVDGQRIRLAGRAAASWRRSRGSIRGRGTA